MTEHGKKSLSYLNGSKGIQPVEFFCTIWRRFKFKTPFVYYCNKALGLTPNPVH